MIVECDSCATRFQLDESRVPLTGIRVRCSNCKKAFFLKHPSASETDIVDAVARDAAAAEGLPAPETTRDLSPTSKLANRGQSESGEEEEDWQFSQDLPPSDDDSDMEALGVADDVAATGADTRDESSFGSADDLEATHNLRKERDQAATQDRSRDDFGPAGGDFGAAADDFGPQSDLTALTEGAVESPDPVPPARPPAHAPKPRAKPGVASGLDSPRAVEGNDLELGDPEDWDFFSDESRERGKVRSAKPQAEPTAAEHKLRRPPVDPLETYRPESVGEVSLAKRMGRGLGWLLTGALFATGLVRGVWSEGRLASPGPATVELGRLSAEGVEGRWVETLGLGWVYAVSGRLVNRTGESVVTGESVQVALLDSAGVRLDHQAVPAGLALARDSLRVSSGPALLAWQSRAAAALAWTQIPPGESLDFLVFLSEVPEEAAGFELENLAMEAVPYQARESGS